MTNIPGAKAELFGRGKVHQDRILEIRYGTRVDTVYTWGTFECIDGVRRSFDDQEARTKVLQNAGQPLDPGRDFLDGAEIVVDHE